jgi:hypothetical protein
MLRKKFVLGFGAPDFSLLFVRFYQAIVRCKCTSPRCAASQGCNVPFGTKGINANELIRLLCGLRILREQVGDIVVVVGLSSHGDRVVL